MSKRITTKEFIQRARKIHIDFYLPDYNTCIEFDGFQHFHKVKNFGGIKKLKITKKHDKIKNEYCRKNNIRLIRISYQKIKKITQILKSNLSVQHSSKCSLAISDY